jgi:hypothetical protein
MRTILALLLSAMAVIAAGCTSETSSVGVAGSGVGYTTTGGTRADLQGIEIRRIGNDQVRLREFQDRSVLSALAYLDAHGIERGRIESVTVDTIGGETGGGFGAMHSAARYSVWVNVKGCERSVSFNAGPTGRVAAPHDPGACLEPSQ